RRRHREGDRHARSARADVRAGRHGHQAGTAGRDLGALGRVPRGNPGGGGRAGHEPRRGGQPCGDASPRGRSRPAQRREGALLVGAADTVIRRIRLALVILGAVVLQTTLFTHLRLFGVAPEVGLVIVVAVAYDHGPETGAMFGFVTGLAMDMFL